MGVVFSGAIGATSRDALVRYDLDALFDAPTWVHGVCRNGDMVVVVGSLSTRGEGVVLRSSDGGASFEDISPADAPSLSECVIDADTLFVTGAGGYFAVSAL